MTETSERLAKYVAAKGMTRESFVTRFPHPLLVEVSPAKTPSEDAPQFATILTPLTSSEKSDQDEDQSETLQVWPVVKRTTGTFEGMVNVGRSLNNDIVLPSNAASKLHAYFRYSSKDQAYSLTDASSTNGTFLNGKRLEPKVMELLQDGDSIVFADLPRRLFYSAQGFHDYLTENF